jgi:hypothetical protein
MDDQPNLNTQENNEEETTPVDMRENTPVNIPDDTPEELSLNQPSERVPTMDFPSPIPTDVTQLPSQVNETPMTDYSTPDTLPPITKKSTKKKRKKHETTEIELINKIHDQIEKLKQEVKELKKIHKTRKPTNKHRKTKRRNELEY